MNRPVARTAGLFAAPGGFPPSDRDRLQVLLQDGDDRPGLFVVPDPVGPPGVRCPGIDGRWDP